MSEIVIMPKQGLQMTEGTITAWLIPEGGEVKKDQPLFEMETDKLAITIDSPADGTLLKIIREAGEVVPVTEPIAVIGDSGEDYQAILAGNGISAPSVPTAEPSAPVVAEPTPAPVSAPDVPADGHIVIMPKQGLQMTEGTITSWLVNEGELAEEGKPLFEMETDKLAITIDSPFSGKLSKIIRKAGEVVPVTEPIAIIGEIGEDYQAILAGSGVDMTPALVATEPTPAPVNEVQSTVTDYREGVAYQVLPVGTDRVFSSPRARTQAEKLGIDYRAIPGSGPMGMVIERDVLGAKDKNTLSAQSAIYPMGGTQIPISGMRKIIAERMMDSLNTLAQANHRLTVDMSAAADLREQFKSVDIKVSYNDIVIRCVAAALKEFPMVNATMGEQYITLHEYVGVGMAVATDTGLLVPVIKNADKLSLTEIAAISKDLATRTKEGKLTPDEMTGGTFTVTNLGMFNIDSFTAIINKPEAGILAVGQVEKQPVLVDDEIVVRPRMQLSLTYDHRILDGVPAALFLRRIKQLLENPGLLV